MIQIMIQPFVILLQQVPVPRDLPLPLPLDTGTLEILIVALFLLHILFVNLMVGASLLTVFFEMLGTVIPRYDSLARRIGQTITVNKSLAVVLGVGPLLCINLLYMTHFYSANALTGNAWIMIIPLVTIAFLITYAHKYTWERWTGKSKKHHIILGMAAAVLFLSIPFIFLSNINLMLFPDKWTAIRGFFSSLQYGNVFPRYFHFLTASLAITGLFIAGWLGRKKYPVEELLPDFTRPQIKRLFYKIAFYATIAQVAFGPLLFVTLPSVGVTFTLLLVIMSGVATAAIILGLMWREINDSDERIGRRYGVIVALFSILVVFMATGRHVYRDASLAPHKQMIANRTAQYDAVELATLMRIEAGLGAGDALASGPTGKSVFKNCAACHAVDKVLAAPPLTEIYSLYKDNPEGIITWAKNPGKKRPEFTQMPSMAQLGEDKLALVADYMLKLGAPEEAGDNDQKM